MKSHIEKRKAHIINQRNNLIEILSNNKEQKLHSRQQQILNIVKNTSSDGTKKLNHPTSRSVSVSVNEKSYTSIHNERIKAASKIKPKVFATAAKSSKINNNNNVIQKSSSSLNEPFNWEDKYYINSIFIKNSRHSNSKLAKIKQVQAKNEIASKRRNIDELNESRKLDEDLTPEFIESEKSESVEDVDKLEQETEQLTAHKKLSQKDIIRQKIQKAIQDRKIFLLRAEIPYLDNALKKRGWVKKYESTKTRHLAYGNFMNLEISTSLGDIFNPDNSLNENAFTYNELKHVPPNFIWDSRNDFIHWKGNIKADTYLNRHEKSFVYTSKLGLATFLEKAYWFFEENISDVFYPRCYNISEDKDSFIEDYRKTAVVSFVRWFVNLVKQNSSSLGKTVCHELIKPLEFAVERCEEIVAVAFDKYLDSEMKHVSPKEWDEFIDIYIKYVHVDEIKDYLRTKKDEDPDSLEIMDIYNRAYFILDQIKCFDQQYELNGIRNIWILKPNMSCCGYGIMMTHKLNNILAKVEVAPKNYYVVQKYIEKPLLIMNTKFDVRHWFLVSKSYPLTIWVYRESLLRFSSRPFTFNNYHEIIHICNTAVQRKYSDQRNLVRTMNWDCRMLNDHLKTIFPQYVCEPWYDVIYPKMCQAIIAAMLAAQDCIDNRENSFELYGADFVIMDDLSVWLIEINTNPRMHPPSSQITERLYPEVLESLLKVILDYPENKNPNTGNFVLVYQQKKEMSLDLENNAELCIKGRKVSKDEILLIDAKLYEVLGEQ